MFYLKKHLDFSGNFREFFGKFPGKFFANFRNFGNLPESFSDFPVFFNNKNINFSSVNYDLYQKTPCVFREFSGISDFPGFSNSGKFSEKLL